MFEEIGLMPILHETPSNLKLPAPELVTFYSDLNGRVVWIEGEIDSSLMETVKHVLRWNREDAAAGLPREKRVPIRVLVNSPGGELDAMLSCYDVLVASATPVYTYNMGVAMSGGLMLLLAGEKRFCLKSSTALLHNGSTTIGGTASQAKATMEYYKAQLAHLSQIVLDRTRIDPKLYKKKQDDEWYFNAGDQLKYDIVHEIVTDLASILG